MPEERLQKILAAAGVASRRASEGLIAAGRVRVDGRLATLGEQVDPATARIEVDGFPVGVGATTEGDDAMQPSLGLDLPDDA